MMYDLRIEVSSEGVRIEKEINSPPLFNYWHCLGGLLLLWVFVVCVFISKMAFIFHMFMFSPFFFKGLQSYFQRGCSCFMPWFDFGWSWTFASFLFALDPQMPSATVITDSVTAAHSCSVSLLLIQSFHQSGLHMNIMFWESSFGGRSEGILSISLLPNPALIV